MNAAQYNNYLRVLYLFRPRIFVLYLSTILNSSLLMFLGDVSFTTEILKFSKLMLSECLSLACMERADFWNYPKRG